MVGKQIEREIGNMLLTDKALACGIAPITLTLFAMFRVICRQWLSSG